MKKIFYLLFLCCIFFYSYSGPVKEPILRIESFLNHTARINRVATDLQNRYIVTFSFDKTVRVWDYSGRLLRILRPPIGEGHEGKIYSGDISPDGRLVVCGGWTGYQWDKSNSIYVFDRETGKMIRRVSNIPGVINDIKFSRDGKLIAIALGNGYGIKVYNVADFSLYGEDTFYGEDSYSVVFSAKYLVSGSYDNYIRIYDISKGLKMIDKIKSYSSKNLFYLSLSPDSRYIAATLTLSRVVELYEVNDSGKISFLRAIDPDISYMGYDDFFSGVTFSEDGMFLYVGGSYQRYVDDDWKRLIFKYDIKGRLVKEIVTPADDLLISLRPLKNGGILFGSCEPSFGIIDSYDNVVMFRSKSIADFRSRYKGFLISYDGKEVGFNIDYEKNPMIFSVSNRDYRERNKEIDYLVAADTTSFSREDWEWKFSVAKINGKEIKIEKGERFVSLAIFPDKRAFIVGGDYKIYKFDVNGNKLWEIPTSAVVWGVNISGNGKVVVAAIGDGTIRWYRSDNGKELLALFPNLDKRRWVLWSPSGYYDCSIGGEELIGWHVNNGSDMESDFFSISKFKSKFYRPYVMAKILDVMDESIVFRDDSRNRVSEEVNKVVDSKGIDFLFPPVVNIIEPYDGFESSDSTIRIKYIVRSPNNEPITGIKVLVDGRPISVTKGLSIVPKEKMRGDVKEVIVNIPNKDCEVSIIAENRFSASDPSSIRIRWKGKEEFIIKPKLYILSIGVGNYKSPNIDKLNFSEKDARDFANALLSQKGKLYRDISIKVLVGNDATKDNILDGLDWIQKEVTSKDIAMIFLSGHGINDQNGIYYFLPIDSDLDRLKRTALPFTDIKNTVVNMVGKVILFVDTCHSGNIMGKRRGSYDINSIINELASAENGLVIFTSSTGNQYSLEDPAWDNGAFTKALIEGLKGKADYLGKGNITINMLDLYISERVKELTRGLQTPTSLRPATIPDFTLVILK